MLTAAVALAIATVVSVFANLNWLSEFDRYGEVPIPGTRTLQLPAGEVELSFHTARTKGWSKKKGELEGPNDVPIPQGLEVTITPPDGVAEPVVINRVGDTITSDGNDAHRRMRVARIPQAGEYTVTTNGDVAIYTDPRMAFGHPSRFGWLPWLLAGLSLLTALAALVVGMVRVARSPAKVVDAEPDAPAPPPSVVAPTTKLIPHRKPAKPKKPAPEGPAELEQRRHNWYAIDEMVREFVPEAVRRDTVTDTKFPKSWLVWSARTKRVTLRIFAKDGSWVVKRTDVYLMDEDDDVHTLAESAKPGSGPLDTDVVDGLRDGLAKTLKYGSPG